MEPTYKILGHLELKQRRSDDFCGNHGAVRASAVAPDAPSRPPDRCYSSTRHIRCGTHGLFTIQLMDCLPSGFSPGAPCCPVCTGWVTLEWGHREVVCLSSVDRTSLRRHPVHQTVRCRTADCPLLSLQPLCDLFSMSSFALFLDPVLALVFC